MTQLDLLSHVYPSSPGFKSPGPSQEAGEGTGSLRSAPISHGNGGFVS